MMMYELVRPVCRASLMQELATDRKKGKINLKAQ